MINPLAFNLLTPAHKYLLSKSQFAILYDDIIANNAETHAEYTCGGLNIERRYLWGGVWAG